MNAQEMVDTTFEKSNPVRAENLPATDVYVGDGNLMLHFSAADHAKRSAANLRPPYLFAKRALDITVSLLFLVLFFPFLLTLALLVRATSKGPVLFKQKRLGMNGDVFWCFKFRTMVADAEEVLKRNTALQAEFSEGFKLKNDPRITPIGAFLRKTSLDELPQFVNVLKGEMSLIGPRPIVVPELSKYGEHGDKLLTVKPGLGGLWQASGRSDVTYEERVAMDMDYIDTCSFWYDVKILWMTAASVCRSRGAY